MSYEVIIEKQALREIGKLAKSGKKKDRDNLYQIFEELKIHPETGTGKPEKLKYNLSGFWSHRINKKDRLIYEIIEEPVNMVVVISALGHY